MIVYQLLPRLFGNTVSADIPFGDALQNGTGKFNDITRKALQEIRLLGASHVWYTGVIEHATLADYSQYGIPPDDADVVKGRAGSPYAIKDYYDVDPDLAEEVPKRMKEFEELVKRTHEEQLKVIIDFVPNHVARGYASDAKPAGTRDFGEDDDRLAAFKPSNNFYYLQNTVFHPPYSVKIPDVVRNRQFTEIPAKATGNDQFTNRPDVNDWYETAKLNYGVDIEGGNIKHFDPIPDTWLKMRDILLFWAAKKVDGFRCDMAEMAPIEFWNWAIPQVKKARPEILFIAEIYSPPRYREFLRASFDFLCDKAGLYDALRNATTGNLQPITPIINREDDISPRLLRFMENHDEPRMASEFFAGDWRKALPAVLVSALVDKAAFMVYFGQEVGEPASRREGFGGADGRTSIYDYGAVPELQKWVNDKKYDGGKLDESQKNLRSFYAWLLNFAKSRDAIAQGIFIPVEEAEGIYGFLRVAGNDRILVLVNFSEREMKKKIHLSENACARASIFDFQKLTGKNIFTNSLVSSIEFGISREAEVLFPPFFVGVYILTIV